MLYYALLFLVVAIVAAIFGFAGIAAAAAGIARILFFIFLVMIEASCQKGADSAQLAGAFVRASQRGATAMIHCWS